MDITFKDRFDHVCSSLMFCSHALRELETLTIKHDLKQVNTLISMPPFNFYKASLSYILVLEYCKLFDKDEIGEKLSNISCLMNETVRANADFLNNETRKVFKNFHKDISSGMLNILKDLRKKRFAHSDKHQVNIPFNIRGFNYDEIKSIKANLDSAILVFNKIANDFVDTTVINFPHQSICISQSHHMIHYMAISKAFYEENFKLAYTQGYQAYHHMIN